MRRKVRKKNSVSCQSTESLLLVCVCVFLLVILFWRTDDSWTTAQLAVWHAFFYSKAKKYFLVSCLLETVCIVLAGVVQENASTNNDNKRWIIIEFLFEIDFDFLDRLISIFYQIICQMKCIHCVHVSTVDVYRMSLEFRKCWIEQIIFIFQTTGSGNRWKRKLLRWDSNFVCWLSLACFHPLWMTANVRANTKHIPIIVEINWLRTNWTTLHHISSTSHEIFKNSIFKTRSSALWRNLFYTLFLLIAYASLYTMKKAK